MPCKMMSLGLATGRNRRRLSLFCSEAARLEPICHERLTALFRDVGFAHFVGWIGFDAGLLVGRLCFIIYPGQLGFERGWIYISRVLRLLFVSFGIDFSFVECILFGVDLFFRLCPGSFRNLDEVGRERRL